MNDALTVSGAKQALFNEEQVQVAVAAFVEACKATKSARQRVGDGPIAYVEVPDHPTRILAATKVLEFARGKPTTTVPTADLTPKGAVGDDGQAFMREVMSDPVARAALKDTVDKMFAASERVRPVEIVVSPAKPQATESQSGGFQR